MEENGRWHAELALNHFRSATGEIVESWSDAQLDGVLNHLRNDYREQPDALSLLMFLEDAKLRRFQSRLQQSLDASRRRR